jgi:hypothetical protein
MRGFLKSLNCNTYIKSTVPICHGYRDHMAAQPPPAVTTQFPFGEGAGMSLEELKEIIIFFYCLRAHPHLPNIPCCL